MPAEGELSPSADTELQDPCLVAQGAPILQDRRRLRPGGTFVLFMTRRNPLTRLLVGRLWQSNLYSVDELTTAFRGAGFSNFHFRTFPPSARYMNLWGHVVEAQR